MLQIPAFLCRQTDLLLAAAGQTGKPINVKKGQFLAPWDMKNVAAKIASTGNERILLCERGASFGYNTLVVRHARVADHGARPATRWCSTRPIRWQQPGGQGDRSAASASFVRCWRAPRSAVGVAAVFMETHQDPDRAPSRRPQHGAAEGAPGAARNPDRLRPPRQSAPTAASS